MKDTEAIGLLKNTGHLEFPFGQWQEVPKGKHLDVPFKENGFATHPCIERAIASYQDFNVQHLDPLCLCHHGRPARCDGGYQSATRELFAMERCGCCDYGPEVQPATGTGSWKSCHNIGDFHAATLKVHRRGIPGFLEPVIDQILGGVIAAYDEMGLRLILTENDDANIDWRFETGRVPWIGLAQVAHNLSCSSEMWCKYSVRYQPSNIVREWITLGNHEIFHNCGGQHTRGGKMSPYLINGLSSTWVGDPSEPIIRKMFGGKPVTPTPPTPPDDPPSPDGFPGHHITTITLPDGRYMDYDSSPRAT